MVARHFPELHLQRIVDHELVRDCLADAQNFLDGFRGLQDAHGSGQDPQYTGFLTVRDQSGRRRFRVETPVARVAGMRLDGRELSLEAEHTR